MQCLLVGRCCSAFPRLGLLCLACVCSSFASASILSMRVPDIRRRMASTSVTSHSLCDIPRSGHLRHRLGYNVPLSPIRYCASFECGLNHTTGSEGFRCAQAVLRVGSAFSIASFQYLPPLSAGPILFASNPKDHRARHPTWRGREGRRLRGLAPRPGSIPPGSLGTMPKNTLVAATALISKSGCDCPLMSGSVSTTAFISSRFSAVIACNGLELTLYLFCCFGTHVPFRVLVFVLQLRRNCFGRSHFRRGICHVGAAIPYHLRATRLHRVARSQLHPLRRCGRGAMTSNPRSGGPAASWLRSGQRLPRYAERTGRPVVAHAFRKQCCAMPADTILAHVEQLLELQRGSARASAAAPSSPIAFQPSTSAWRDETAAGVPAGSAPSTNNAAFARRVAMSTTSPLTEHHLQAYDHCPHA